MKATHKYTTQYDKMTQMPVERLVLTLGVPTTISMLVTTFYNMADTYFVGRLGTSATGAIGVLYPLMGIIQALGFLLGQGSGSNISRLLGAKKHDRASDFASTGFFYSLIGGVLLLVIGVIFLNPMLYLLGSTDTILPFAREYGIYILLCSPAMISSFVLNNILRFEGRANLAMVGLLIGGLVNVVGDWFTIRILGMGIEGVGISTMLSNYLSAGLLLSNFFSNKTVTKIQIKRVFFKNMSRRNTASDSSGVIPDLSSYNNDEVENQLVDDLESDSPDRSHNNNPENYRDDRLIKSRSSDGEAESDKQKSLSDRIIILNIILVGLPSLARQGMSSLATMLMNRMALPYGDPAIAAMSIVMKLGFVLFAVGLGIGQGYQPVCGFNYGAKKFDRVRRASYFTWFFSTAVVGSFSLVAWIFASDLVGIFRDDPAVIAIGVPALHYQLLTMIVIPVSFCGNMLFQSTGMSGRALFLSCLRSGLCYIPVLLIVVPMFGLFGIQIAQPIADVIAAAITLPFFLRFLRSMKTV